jgi:hypothetical protein
VLVQYSNVQLFLPFKNNPQQKEKKLGGNEQSRSAKEKKKAVKHSFNVRQTHRTSSAWSEPKDTVGQTEPSTLSSQTFVHPSSTMKYYSFQQGGTGGTDSARRSSEPNHGGRNCKQQTSHKRKKQEDGGYHGATAETTATAEPTTATAEKMERPRSTSCCCNFTDAKSAVDRAVDRAVYGNDLSVLLLGLHSVQEPTTATIIVHRWYNRHRHHRHKKRNIIHVDNKDTKRATTKASRNDGVTIVFFFVPGWTWKP